MKQMQLLRTAPYVLPHEPIGNRFAPRVAGPTRSAQQFRRDVNPHLFATDLDEVLDGTRAVWRELAGERLFITGGTGFFGTWLLESFVWACRRLDLGATAVVLSRDPDAFAVRMPHLASAAELSFLRGNAADFAFPEGRFACVVHAAIQPSEPNVAENDRLERELRAMQRILDFAVHAGAARVLFTSSGAVYGPQPEDLALVPETYLGAPDPTNVRTTYGQSKRLCEHLCALHVAQFGMHVTVARGFAFVGPHLPLTANFAIGNFMRDAMAGGPIRIAGDGTPHRSYMYATDLAVWLWTILQRGAAGRAYNVGSEAALSIGELAREVVRANGTTVPIVTAQSPSPDTPVERYVPCTARARDELGLVLRVPLDEAIRRTLAWHRRPT